MLPARLQFSIQRFLRAPDIRAERLDTSEGANNMCAWAAQVFVDRTLGARLLYVQGARQRWHAKTSEHLHWNYYTTSWADAWHVMVQYGPYAIDFTARQFDPRLPYPWVMPRAQVSRHWRIVSSVEF